MVKRIIRYNKFTNTDIEEPFRYEYIFMIVNEPREIKRIRERIYEQLEPILELKNLFYGGISKTNGLYYDFFSFLSSKGDIYQPNKIYDVDNQQFKKDRNLYLKSGISTEVGLEKYLKSVVDANIDLFG